MHRFASTSSHGELLSAADLLLANARGVLCSSSNLCLSVTLPRLNIHNIFQRINSQTVSLRGSLSGRGAGCYTTPRAKGTFATVAFSRYSTIHPVGHLGGVWEANKAPQLQSSISTGQSLPRISSVCSLSYQACIKVTVHRRAECQDVGAGVGRIKPVA